MTRKELFLRENAVINAYSIGNKSTAIDYIMKLRERNTRCKLYRFRPPRLHEINALEEEKIYLCRPSQYEDFGDCKIEYDIPDLFNYYLRDVKYPEHKNDICFIDNNVIHKLIQKIEEDYKFQQLNNNIRNECLIACITESYNSYMWKHYAQNSEGICFEYEMDSIIMGIKTPLRFFPVRYVENRSETKDIKLNSDDFKDTIINCEKAAKKYLLSCLTKDKFPYAKEYEWRLIYDHITLDNNSTGTLFDFILPSKVILGKNISKNPSFSDSIIECAKNKGITVEEQ